MDRKLKLYNISFYAIVASGIIFILFTNPFLVRMYDPWRYHLKNIADFYNGVNGAGRIWHLTWANIFKMIGINDIFAWAKIIHTVQFFLAAFLVYYFSKTVFNILIKSPDSKLYVTGSVISSRPVPACQGSPEALSHKEGFPVSGPVEDDRYALRRIQIKFLSLFSVFLWFIGNGTPSVAYQQAWIMWYSVTYQGLTIPLLWYATALTLKIFYEDFNVKGIIFRIIQIAIVSVIIAKYHPLELLYYLIYLAIIILMNIRRILRAKNGKIYLISIAVICIFLIITIKYFLQQQPTPFYTLISSNESAGQILRQINSSGHRIVKTLNRFPDSFSELAQISLILAVIFRIFYLSVKETKISFKTSLFDCLLVSSLFFFLVPIVPFLAGVAGYITIDEQVYRFFYAPPWFIFLPFCLYVIMDGNYKPKIPNVISNNTFYRIIKEKEIEISKRKVVTDFLATGLILFVLFTVLHRNAFAIRKNISNLFMFKTTASNIKSIINSLDKSKVGMQYSQDDMEKRGDNSLK
jgi:hypothetical protein